MNTRLGFAVSLIALIGWVPACGKSDESGQNSASVSSSSESSSTQGNAALQYHRAFLVGDETIEPDGMAMSPSIYQRLIALVRKGATLERCDWGFSHKDDIVLRWSGLLAHQEAALAMAGVMAHSVDAQLDDGEFEGAIQDVEAGLALSRRIFREGGVSTAITQIRAEGKILAAVEKHLAGFPKNTRERLGRLCNLYGGWMTTQEAIENKAQMIAATRNEFKAGRLSEETLREMLTEEHSSSAVVSGWDAEKLSETLAQMYGFQTKLLAVIAVGDQSAAELEDTERRLAKAVPEPVRGTVYSGVHRLVEAERDLARRWQVILGVSE